MRPRTVTCVPNSICSGESSMSSSTLSNVRIAQIAISRLTHRASRLMNLRGRAQMHHPGIQLAPLVDVLLLLLIFFLLTWNAARTENELDVKVPKASAAREKSAPIGDVVVNVKADGNVVVNRRTLSGPELSELLKSLIQLNADQAVVIR